MHKWAQNGHSAEPDERLASTCGAGDKPNHVDLFWARDAAQLVWTPIYNWLSAHPPSAAP
jgi:hypothetical protein